MTQIKTTRVYADAAGEPGDGYRVFADRLWPRGESKEKFHYDLWVKDVAPSTSLREWYHADRENRWDEFARRYMAELEANPSATALAEKISAYPVVTILYGSKDTGHNNALILAEFLVNKLKTLQR